jgi:hypothetical protein
MALNFTELIQLAAERQKQGVATRFRTTLSSNQTNGIVSCATGFTNYIAGGAVGPILRSPRVSTSGGEPLNYLFSDRTINLAPPAPPGGFQGSELQPFSIRAADKIALSIGAGRFALGLSTAKITLLSHGNATFSFPVEVKGDLLIGIGAAIGNASAVDHAVYTIAFEFVENVRPPR